MERIACLKWIGGILVVIGIAIVCTWEIILTRFLSKEFALSPTSQIYPIWEKAKFPILLDIYLFNCTNTEELSRNFKPNFQEVGPYRFKEYQDKVNITWNENNTVTYRVQRFWYFDEKESVSSLEENVTMLNMPPVVASYKGRNMGAFAAFSLSLSMKVLEKSIWVTKSVREFLFDGYPDPLLTLSSMFSGGDSQKVGFFYGRNGTFSADGYYNMETGVGDLSRIGILQQWNFANKTRAYDEGCNGVQGFVGNFFPPKMTKDPFYFFSGEICKRIKFFYAEEVEIHGLKAYKFLPENTSMDNGHTDPETKCDCGGDNCMPPGILNISECVKGVPMFASSPHFLGADLGYLQNVTGLSPDANRSDFYIIVEPNLGIPLEMAAHLQYNTLLQQNTKFSLFEDVPNLVYPLFWVKKKIGINEETAQNIKLILFLPTLGTICAVGLILLGLLAISISLLPRFFKRIRGSPATKIGKRKIFDEVSFSKSNGMTFKNEEEDKEKELINNGKDALNNEEKMLTFLTCKETDILT